MYSDQTMMNDEFKRKQDHCENLEFYYILNFSADYIFEQCLETKLYSQI